MPKIPFFLLIWPECGYWGSLDKSVKCSVNPPASLVGITGETAQQRTELLLAQGHTLVGIDNLNDPDDVRLQRWRLARPTWRPVGVHLLPAGHSRWSGAPPSIQLETRRYNQSGRASWRPPICG